MFFPLSGENSHAKVVKRQAGKRGGAVLVQQVNVTIARLIRAKAREISGVIDRYVALTNPKALGLGLNVFINISLKEQAGRKLST